MNLADLDAALESLTPIMRDEITHIVFWSVAIAAEPLNREILYEMHDSKSGERGRIGEALQKLIDGGFIRLATGPHKYLVTTQWWEALRAFGGVYDQSNFRQP